MKKEIFIILILSLLFTVGCQSANTESDDADMQNEQTIEEQKISREEKKADMKPADGKNPNGRMDIALEDLDTSGFSQEQLDMLEKYEDGEVTMPELVSNGVFTREELGIGNKQVMLGLG